jgi:hydroxymethylbilane synthase
MMRLCIATRRSALALAQTRQIVERLRSLHAALEVEELHVVTQGDRIQDRALSEIGGKGLFVKEIEEALLDGRADFAVHSMKDLPAEMPAGLVVGAVPEREDPRDVVVTRDGRPLADLAPASRVGTSSLRRLVQLRAWRPDLSVVPLRGNVDTRLRKCATGEVDAIVLARAGMSRLGLLDRVTETLDVERMLPAIAQGALALQRRAEDERVALLLAPLAHSETALAVAAERGVLVAVEGSCKLPVAAFAIRDGERMRLRAMLCDEDGSRMRRRDIGFEFPDSEARAYALGFELGKELR